MRRRFLLSFVFIILACRLYAHGGESKEVVEPVQVQSPLLLSSQDVHYQVSFNFSGLYPFNGFFGVGSGFFRVWMRPQPYRQESYRVGLSSTYFLSRVMGLTVDMGMGWAKHHVQLSFFDQDENFLSDKWVKMTRYSLDMALLMRYQSTVNEYFGITLDIGWFYAYGLPANMDGVSREEELAVRKEIAFFGVQHNHGPVFKLGLETGMMSGGIFLPIGYQLRYNFGLGWQHGFYVGLGWKG